MNSNSSNNNEQNENPVQPNAEHEGQTNTDAETE